jgi:hypothetical protein
MCWKYPDVAGVKWGTVAAPKQLGGADCPGSRAAEEQGERFARIPMASRAPRLYHLSFERT